MLVAAVALFGLVLHLGLGDEDEGTHPGDVPCAGGLASRRTWWAYSVA